MQAKPHDLLARRSETMQAVALPDGGMVYIDRNLDPGILGPLGKKNWEYSDTMAALICEKIRTGSLMKDITKEPGMPNYSVISRWRREREEFNEALVQARQDRAEILKEEALQEALDLADNPPVDQEVAAAKLKVDTIKWVAGVDHPDRFGSKKEAGISVGTAVIMVDTGIKREPPRDVGGNLDGSQNYLTADSADTAGDSLRGNAPADISSEPRSDDVLNRGPERK